MTSINAAFLLWLLVTTGLETANSGRLNREKKSIKTKHVLGIDKVGSDDKTKQAENEVEGAVADSTEEEEAKQEARAEEVEEQDSRPTVGDMVIILNTSRTRDKCDTVIGKQSFIRKDDKDRNPYQIENQQCTIWLHEEDVRLIADRATLEAIASAKSIASWASSKSLTSKMGWGAHAEFSDATLLADDSRSFAVHRAVLAVASPFFRSAFSGEMAEAENKEIKLPGAPAEVVESLLAYIYSGKLDKSRAFAMLPFAHLYNVTDLSEACIAQMVRSLNVSNIVATVHALRPLVDDLASAKEALEQVGAAAQDNTHLQWEMMLHL